MYCFSLSCQLVSELLKWIIAISLFSQSWKTQKLHCHLNYLQMKGKMPSFPWQNSKRCNGDKARLPSPGIPPISAGLLELWRWSMLAVHKHKYVVPGQESHYIFYFTIAVPDFQQHVMFKQNSNWILSLLHRKKISSSSLSSPKETALQHFFS